MSSKSSPPSTPSDLDITTDSELDFPHWVSEATTTGIPCYNYVPGVLIEIVNRLPAHCLITASLSDGWTAAIQQFSVSLNRDAFFLQILAQGLNLSLEEVQAKYAFFVDGYWHRWPEMLTGSSVDGCKILIARKL